ncbi:158aa long hypothetical protein [Pyrococcus horikoshii OT3]|uniref:Uncharacterized protein n=1 Tax=Pyrococcus horikoshii (strain ATCC 700860 / DSM 12428 / JCM 9974 / NBRC 100139 / OT-3) TaxID=70601 RepID=O59541_PYRHO|nr:158aa long hypothetical protein [Pyrococcus horikoshii OT3]
MNLHSKAYLDYPFLICYCSRCKEDINTKPSNICLPNFFILEVNINHLSTYSEVSPNWLPYIQTIKGSSHRIGYIVSYRTIPLMSKIKWSYEIITLFNRLRKLVYPLRGYAPQVTINENYYICIFFLCELHYFLHCTSLSRNWPFINEAIDFNSLWNLR